VKIATDNWVKTFSIISKMCLAFIVNMGMIIAFPLWVVSLGHIKLSGELYKIADGLITKLFEEMGE
jgi:hypothetical protein